MLSGPADVWRTMKVTRNWWSIFPVMAGLRNQAIIEFKNGLRFYYAKDLFSVEHFLEQPYGLAEVKGRVVIDVGAFSGDSTIYFAWRGAKKVYAFEPIPTAYEMAANNIRLNGIQNIEIFNEAIGYTEGELVLDKDQTADRSFSMAEHPKEGAGGKRIHVKPFESLVSELRLDDAVLKMDCEGCEYEVLLNARDELLLPFGQIILEYHHGADKIVERLAKAGYETNLLDIKGRHVRETSQGLGLLYARRTAIAQAPGDDG